MKRALPAAEEFMRSRIAGCRKGGEKSGFTRRQSAKRAAVECAIAHKLARGEYDHNAASHIAKYLSVSPRYVRMVAVEVKKGK